MYLKGSTHYLTKEEAYRRFPEDDNHEFRLEQDGTYSVFELVNEPVQVGQVKWNKN